MKPVLQLLVLVCLAVLHPALMLGALCVMLAGISISSSARSAKQRVIDVKQRALESSREIRAQLLVRRMQKMMRT